MSKQVLDNAEMHTASNQKPISDNSNRKKIRLGYKILMMSLAFLLIILGSLLFIRAIITNSDIRFPIDEQIDDFPINEGSQKFTFKDTQNDSSNIINFVSNQPLSDTNSRFLLVNQMNSSQLYKIDGNTILKLTDIPRQVVDVFILDNEEIFLITEKSSVQELIFQDSEKGLSVLFKTEPNEKIQSIFVDVNLGVIYMIISLGANTAKLVSLDNSLQPSILNISGNITTLMRIIKLNDNDDLFLFDLNKCYVFERRLRDYKTVPCGLEPMSSFEKFKFRPNVWNVQSLNPNDFSNIDRYSPNIQNFVRIMNTQPGSIVAPFDISDQLIVVMLLSLEQVQIDGSTEVKFDYVGTVNIRNFRIERNIDYLPSGESWRDVQLFLSADTIYAIVSFNETQQLFRIEETNESSDEMQDTTLSSDTTENNTGGMQKKWSLVKLPDHEDSIFTNMKVYYYFPDLPVRPNYLVNVQN